MDFTVVTNTCFIVILIDFPYDVAYYSNEDIGHKS